MKGSNFLLRVLVAIFASIYAGSMYTTLAVFTSPTATSYLVFTSLTFAYIVYLLGNSGAKVGRITAVVIWLVALGSMSWLDVPLPVWMATLVASIWLVQSLFYYAGIVPMMFNLALQIFGVVCASAAYLHTHSITLSVWSYFLVLALDVFIPDTAYARGAKTSRQVQGNQDFERAYANAQHALQQHLNHNRHYRSH